MPKCHAVEVECRLSEKVEVCQSQGGKCDNTKSMEEATTKKIMDHSCYFIHGMKLSPKSWRFTNEDLDEIWGGRPLGHQQGQDVVRAFKEYMVHTMEKIHGFYLKFTYSKGIQIDMQQVIWI